MPQDAAGAAAAAETAWAARTTEQIWDPTPQPATSFLLSRCCQTFEESILLNIALRQR